MDRLRKLGWLLLCGTLVGGHFQCLEYDVSCASGDASCDGLAAFFLWNQPCHARDWTTYFGSEVGIEVAESIALSGDAGFVMAGKAFQPFGTPLRAFTSPGTRNIFVIKFDEDGNYLWHTFLGLSGDRPVRMIGTNDGYLIAGTGTASFGTPIRAYSAGNDAILLKIDLNGNLLWHTYFGTAATEEFSGIIADGFGNFIVIGTSQGDVTGAGNIVVSHSDPGVSHFVAVKYDANGNVLWQTHIGGSSQDNGRSMTAVAGGFVLVGPSDGPLNAAFNNQINAHTGIGNTDFLAVAINTNGQYLWHTFHGAAGSTDDPVFVRSLAGGNLLLGGVSNTTWGTPVNPHPDPGAQPAMAMFTLNANGSLVWNTFLGNAGASGNNLVGAVQRANGDIVFLGGSSASWGTPVRPYQGLLDFVLGVLSPDSGVLLRHAFYGNAATNEQAAPIAFAQSCDNGFIWSGASEGNFGAPVNPYAGTGAQGYVQKVSPGGAL